MNKTSDNFSDALDAQINNNPRLDVSYLIDWISTAAKLDAKNTDMITPQCKITPCEQLSDWGEWQVDFEADEFQMQICFFHNWFVPPRHGCELLYVPKLNVEKINLIYEYYYKHLLVVTVDAELAIRQLLKYSKSLCMFSMTLYAVNKKRNKLRRWPLIGEWLSEIYFSPWLGSTVESKLGTLDFKSVTIMHEFEGWLESVMTEDEKNERKKSYERYWKGVPEEERGIEIYVT